MTCAADGTCPADSADVVVHLLGVRHHGPGSARALLGALDRVEPDAVLVELPADVAAVLPLVADDELVPPVALLGYVAERPERAAFYPLARFSPEWVALRWAAGRGIRSVPIDRPLAHTLAPGGPGPLPGTDALALLASAAGYDDPERWWEDVVEHRGDTAADGPLATFAAVAEAMAAVRSTPVRSTPARSTPIRTTSERGDSLSNVGPAPAAGGDEAVREATMRQAIRQARAEGARRMAVVCGAWHVPALADLGGRAEAAADARLVRSSATGGGKAKVAVTWVPWSHRRLATASGYGAGVSSPGWYDHVFAHPGRDLVPRWFTRVARLLREADHGVSPEHVIAAVRLADGLAGLRARPRPGLPEVLDAAGAVLADGSTGPLALVHDRLVVGDDLGSVPERTPMVPLARDLHAHQRRLRLRPEATSRTLEVDLRTPLGRGRSHLLHRLAVLGVPWGRPAEGRGSSGTFRETWVLRWEPELELALVEASACGTTLAAAATARLLERAADTATVAATASTVAATRSTTTTITTITTSTTSTHLADLTALVEAALLADLPDAVAPLMAALAERAALEADTARLLDAVGPLARALRYGDVRGTDSAALREVVDGLVVRALVGLPGACASLDDEGAAAMAERLTATQSALALLDHPARRAAWPDALTRMTVGDRVAGAVQGRAVRLLHDAGSWDGERAGAALARALSIGTPAARGATFVEGFLAGSGTVLVHDEALLRLLDAWVASLPPDAFGAVVPLLRRTFGAFEAAERRQLGRLVAARGETGPVTPYGWDLDEARAEAALATVAALLGRELA